MTKKMLVIIILISFMQMVLWAGDLDETLEELSGEAAESYVAPIVSGLGTNFNGGWFHKSPKSKFLGLDFEIGIVGMATFFSDENKHFDTVGTVKVNQDMADELADGNQEIADALLGEDITVHISGPTILGSGNEEIVFTFDNPTIEYTDENDETQTLDVGDEEINTGVTGLLEDVSMLPIFTPQVAIGTVLGTSLTLRALPPFDVPDLGKVSYYGGGFQHNINEWLPIPFVDVSLAASGQFLKLGDYVSASGFNGGFNVSKQFGPKALCVTPYVGAMLEKYTMNFSYDYYLSESVDPLEIDFDLESENTYRVLIGSAFRMGFGYFNIDYNLGEYQSLTLGLGLTF